MSPEKETADGAVDGILRRQARFGWRALLVFLAFGIVLEAFLGFKVGWYLDVSSEARRTVWRLAHAHGALLSLVCVVHALSVRAFPGPSVRRLRLVSALLVAGVVLLPGGFFLGGLAVYGGDPGVGIFLAPVGAVLLFVGLHYVARD